MKKSYLQHLKSSSNKPVRLQEARGVITYTAAKILAGLLILLFGGITSRLMSKRNIKLEEEIKKITKINYLVYVYNADVPQCFCFGGVGKKAIFVSSVLFDLLNRQELIAVCLHEASLIKDFSYLKTIIATSAIESASAAYMLSILKRVYQFQMFTKGGFLAFFFFLTILNLYIALYYFRAINRSYTKKADVYASELGFGEELRTALTKINYWYDVEFKKLKPNKLKLIFMKINKFVASNPGFQERIKNLFDDNRIYEALGNEDKQAIEQIVNDNIVRT